MSCPDLSEYREGFNDRGRGRLNARASELRKDLISDAVDIFKVLQQLDIYNRDQTETGTIRFWVLGDETEAPMVDDQFQTTKSFAVQSLRGSRRLRFHIPVPLDFDDDDMESVKNLEAPSQIFAEKVRVAGKARHTIRRYAIDKEHTYEYRTIADTQAEEEIGPIDPWHEFYRQFDPGITTITELNQNLVNWHAIAQREIVIGEAGTTVNL